MERDLCEKWLVLFEGKELSFKAESDERTSDCSPEIEPRIHQRISHIR